MPMQQVQLGNDNEIIIDQINGSAAYCIVVVVVEKMDPRSFDSLDFPRLTRPRFDSLDHV
jgi:hypothetical protein